MRPTYYGAHMWGWERKDGGRGEPGPRVVPEFGRALEALARLCVTLSYVVREAGSNDRPRGWTAY